MNQLFCDPDKIKYGLLYNGKIIVVFPSL